VREAGIRIDALDRLIGGLGLGKAGEAGSQHKGSQVHGVKPR
jgi:hypothetical protein